MQFKIQNNTEFSELLDQIFGSALIDPDVFISGGVPRLLWHGDDWYNHDVDLFFKNQAAFDRMKNRMDYQPNPYGSWTNVIKNMVSNNITFTKKEPFTSINAITYVLKFKDKEIKVQLIRKQFYQNIIEVWNDFDFTVCQYAVDQRYLYASYEAVRDCELKQLSMVKDTKKIPKASRVIKYGIYGFTADNLIMQNLVARHLAGESLVDQQGDTDDIEY